MGSIAQGKLCISVHLANKGLSKAICLLGGSHGFNGKVGEAPVRRQNKQSWSREGGRRQPGLKKDEVPNQLSPIRKWSHFSECKPGLLQGLVLPLVLGCLVLPQEPTGVPRVTSSRVS